MREKEREESAWVIESECAIEEESGFPWQKK